MKTVRQGNYINLVVEMPEGPEAHTIADSLKKKIMGDETKEYWLQDVTLGSQTKKINIAGLTVPIKLKDILAYGKKVLFILENGLIVTSLGMTGRFCYTPTEHSNVMLTICSCSSMGEIVVVEDTKVVYFHDSRRFGSFEYIYTDERVKECFSTVGPDMISCPPSKEQYLARFRQASAGTQVCSFLMDQSYFSGVGNYLKSEIMYKCGFRPDRTLGSLSDDDVENLRLTTIEIINNSYKCGGLTLSDYWSPDGNPGSYQPLVYGRITDIFGNTVYRGNFTRDSRVTYWVPALQT